MLHTNERRVQARETQAAEVIQDAVLQPAAQFGGGSSASTVTSYHSS